jgi:hypothetical protein
MKDGRTPALAAGIKVILVVIFSGPNQTHYQLNSHLQSNTLELDDKT